MLSSFEVLLGEVSGDMRINPRKFDAANWNPAALDRAGSAHPVAEFSMIPLKGDQPERLAPMFRASPPPLEYCNMFISCIFWRTRADRAEYWNFSKTTGPFSSKILGSFLKGSRSRWLRRSFLAFLLKLPAKFSGEERCADNIFQPAGAHLEE